MLVILEPRAGDKLGDQIDLANELLTKDYVDEVQLQMNDGTHYMRQPMDGDQIRKFIWEGYKNDIGIVTYYAEELEFVPFCSRITVGFNGEVVFTTSAMSDVQDLSSLYNRCTVQGILDEEIDENVRKRFINWAEDHIVNFREDFDY